MTAYFTDPMAEEFRKALEEAFKETKKEKKRAKSNRRLQSGKSRVSQNKHSSRAGKVNE